MVKAVLLVLALLLPSLAQKQLSSPKTTQQSPQASRVAAKKKAPAKKTVRKSTSRRRPRARRIAARPNIEYVHLVPEPPAYSWRQAEPGSAVACLHCPSTTLMLAHSFTGLPYKRGGSSPETGFDCSGFVRHVFEHSCSVGLPRTASEQFAYGVEVDRDDLLPGDLVFFRGRRGWHVGIYAGSGQFIHSPNRRESIKLSSLSAPYYKRAFKGARRLTTSLFEPALVAVPPPSDSLSTVAEVSGAN